MRFYKFMKSLFELYKIHTGKVSDKWELYLIEYDRLFAPFRDQKISLLEIGIQNGGSLEIWGQYFPNAHKLVGCDINPDCTNLTFDDPRIAIVVGDATLKEVQATVLAHCDSFDLIIEDGSHTSGDIVKAFARYFPALKTGGLFVAEDLHCSYWQEYDGGIHHPFSSISFFKHLADIVNHEHWGVSKSQSELIAGFKELLNIDFQDELLAEISSIEFINSLCIVRKRIKDINHLGTRIISGRIELIVEGHHSLLDTQINIPDQTKNDWTILSKSPAEQFQQLHADIQAKKAETEQLRFDVKAKQVLINQLNQELVTIKNSRSWRYTPALRTLASLMLLPLHFSRKIKAKAKHNHGYKNLVVKVFQISRKEGWKGISARWSGNKSSALVITNEGQAVDRSDYQSWIKLYDTLDAQDIEQIKIDIKGFKTLPKISVVMPVYNAPLNFLKEAIESVQKQIYPNWELCIADDASTDIRIRPMLETFVKNDKRIKVVYRPENGHISAASNSALDLATGDFIALLDNDDLLAVHALYLVSKTIIENPDAVLIYSDEDKINQNGVRYDPYFKCELNYELLLAQNMVSHLGVYRRSLIKQIGGFRKGFEGSQDYDLVLRILEIKGADRILHIPRVLYHWRAIPGSTALNAGEKNYAVDAARLAIAEHLQRSGRGGTVSPAPEIPSLNRVRYRLPSFLPLVSIIIPTRDRADILSICLNSVLQKTTYNNLEIIVVDNRSEEEATRQLLEQLPKSKLTVLRDDGPFNYSAINNAAVLQSKGEVICLMNNDIEILSHDWIEEMLSFASQPDVGCVGARLWYPNGQLQHGGVITGIGGVAGHSHKNILKGDPGYFGRAMLHQSLSAVTGACLMIRRSVWDEVNGLDEGLAVAFNDVDLCLKVQELGYRNVWTPYAEMNHHESASRGLEITPEKQARFMGEVKRIQEKWGDSLKNDPAYNPNLTLDHEDFSLARPPRTP